MTSKISQDLQGLRKVARILSKYFSEGTKVERHDEVRHWYRYNIWNDQKPEKIPWEYFSFETPEGDKYVLWNQKEYDPDSSFGIRFSGRSKNSIDECLIPHIGNSSIRDQVGGKYKVSGWGFPVSEADYHFAMDINEIKDVLPVIRATREYTALFKDSNFIKKMDEFKLTREHLEDLRSDIHDHVRNYGKKFKKVK